MGGALLSSSLEVGPLVDVWEMLLERNDTRAIVLLTSRLLPEDKSGPDDPDSVVADRS